VTTAALFSARTTIPETVGVHAAQLLEPMPAPAPHTACGYLIYQPSWYLGPDAEVTCWRCLKATPRITEED
jgi:hypothetical protein